MLVTELRETSSGRFVVGFSDGSELRAGLDAVADLSLYKGRELDEDEFSQLSSAAALSACKERALRLIGMRPMSCKELFDKLTEKGESPENAATAVSWLLEMHYMDDEQYAGMVVRHYAAKGYGVQRIKNELYRRGVPKKYWESALEEMPETEDTLYKLLCRKLRSDAPDKAELKRAADSLFRRGYSWDEIKSAINRFQDEHYTD